MNRLVRSLVLPALAALILACGKGDQTSRASSDAAPTLSQGSGEADTAAIEIASVSDTAELQFPAGPELRPLTGTDQAPFASNASLSSPLKGAFTVVNAGGRTPCKAPSAEVMALYDKYGARHICFTYFLEANSSWHNVVTDAVYRAIGLVLPGLDQIELYQPNSNVVRFQVKQDNSYRLYTYWSHDLSNVPPPGKHTDHKFINPMDRSVDYYMKIRMRSGRNTRIGGVAEVVFVPQELCESARRDQFLNGIGTQRPCPHNEAPVFR